MPNTCVPNAGPADVCPASCPVVCPPDHTMCPGGTDAAGCQMPDACMPMTFGTDGAACPWQMIVQLSPVLHQCVKTFGQTKDATNGRINVAKIKRSKRTVKRLVENAKNLFESLE